MYQLFITIFVRAGLFSWVVQSCKGILANFVNDVLNVDITFFTFPHGQSQPTICQKTKPVEPNLRLSWF